MSYVYTMQVTWVRRKLGGHLTLLRTAEGRLGCALPCPLCRLQVHMP